MSGDLISLPVRVPAVMAPAVRAEVPELVDIAVSLGKIERTIRWLERRGVERLGHSSHRWGGLRVRVKHSHVLRMLLADEMVSRGHTSTGGMRIEHWEARDSATGVLIEWDEERPEGRR